MEEHSSLVDVNPNDFVYGSRRGTNLHDLLIHTKEKVRTQPQLWKRKPTTGRQLSQPP